ncbi:hypothetical protein [Lysinibacillus sp. NPDC059133]|uniref:hypothetical protein n=1 Tax=Lysinibacillus sp. NPDC059133 TaxID=3346737 RepID=UPI0036797464
MVVCEKHFKVNNGFTASISPFVMLSIMFPVDMLPNLLQMIGKVFPATWGYLNSSDDKWGMMSILSLILTIIVTLLLCTWRLGRLHTIE